MSSFSLGSTVDGSSMEFVGVVLCNEIKCDVMKTYMYAIQT